MILCVILWSSVATHAWAQKATSIEYQDVTIHNARTVVHDGTFVNVNQSNSIGFDVQISGTATVTFRVSGAGRFGWNDLTCYPSDSTTGVTSATATGFYQCNVAGADVASARLDVCTGCTVTVVARTGTAIYGKSSGSGGGGGSGDVTDVWACTSGNCNALTGAAGDSLDAGSADSSKPATRSTSLPGTCTEGQLHQDTDSGGSEHYVCIAANTWVKLIGASDTHQLLSTTHSDTVAGSPVTGDILIGDAGNLWSTLGGPTSATERCFNSTGTGTTANPPYWGPCSPINAQTGTTYTVVLADSRKLVTLNNASAIAVTLPQATTAGFASGYYFYAKAIGAGTATITPTTSTINGAASLALAQNEGALIWSNGTNYEALKWAVSSGSSTPSLRTTTFVNEEEFCSGLNTNGNIGDHGLYMASGAFANVNPTQGHPCIINIATGASAGNLGRLFFGANDSAVAVMGDVQHMRFIIRPQSLDANTAIRCGFIVTTATTLEGSDGVYFSYLNSASANWRAVTRVTSLTATSSSVAAGSGTWVQFDITRNGSNWDFSINEAAAFATPATSTGPASGAIGKIGCVLDTAAAAAKNIDYDYFGWKPLDTLSARHP